ncbi:restriction endonuclease subunit S [Providencia alcalifaciens]|uniref:restriction endonuclease subunit S n=1 Tax=Providencia alcalifaciens TaxID=126385 RepID=UPI001CE10123|nr:restriction endonuclease subunit S [Providencia alcalifaciens]UBX49291.1 restriction endonuclease subunit S [Providencia alcalifaciens]
MGNNSWQEVKLSDLGEVARGRSRHRPRYAEHLYGGKYPFIQTGDIKASEGRISSHGQTYSEAGLAQSRLWPTDTMCITIAANIAETGILQYPACFPDSVIGFIADKNKADVYFIEYVFRKLRKDIQRQATGSVQDNINLQTFERLKFKVPPVEEQHRIANVLNHFDKKITLNRQINQTLEKMAQTLFKSWFVDFDPIIDNALDAGFFEQDFAFSDELLRRVEVRKAVRESDNFKPLSEDIRQLFPNAFEECTESALGLGGWVPKGWRISKLSDFGNIICGKTPSKKENSFYGNDVPFIKIPDMHGNVFITRTFDNLSFEGSKSQIKKLIPEDSICVSSIATVGLVSITTKSAHTNQQINSVVPEYKYFRDYLYFSLLNKNKHFHDLASGGSTTLNMNTTLFSNVLFIQPDKFILELFQQQSGQLLERIKCSQYEIGELTQLRDTLLPKLISGELSLDDIKIDIPEETLI